MHAFWTMIDNATVRIIANDDIQFRFVYQNEPVRINLPTSFYQNNSQKAHLSSNWIFKAYNRNIDCQKKFEDNLKELISDDKFQHALKGKNVTINTVQEMKDIISTNALKDMMRSPVKKINWDSVDIVCRILFIRGVLLAYTREIVIWTWMGTNMNCKNFGTMSAPSNSLIMAAMLRFSMKKTKSFSIKHGFSQCLAVRPIHMAIPLRKPSTFWWQTIAFQLLLRKMRVRGIVRWLLEDLEYEISCENVAELHLSLRKNQKKRINGFLKTAKELSDYLND